MIAFGWRGAVELALPADEPARSSRRTGRALAMLYAICPRTCRGRWRSGGSAPRPPRRLKVLQEAAGSSRRGRTRTSNAQDPGPFRLWGRDGAESLARGAIAGRTTTLRGSRRLCGVTVKPSRGLSARGMRWRSDARAPGGPAPITLIARGKAGSMPASRRAALGGATGRSHRFGTLRGMAPWRGIEWFMSVGDHETDIQPQDRAFAPSVVIITSKKLLHHLRTSPSPRAAPFAVRGRGADRPRRHTQKAAARPTVNRARASSTRDDPQPARRD